MKQKAFTIIEIMLVMIIIGILSIGIGSFYDYNSKTQRYKAETCMNNLNGELQGFMRTAFTSKALQSWTLEVFPDYYGIEFRRDRQDIRLGYSMLSGVLNGVCPLGEIAEDSRCIYKTIKLDTYCQQKEVSLLRTWAKEISSWDFFVKMNKGFRQVKPQEITTFRFWMGSDDTSKFTGSVQFNICIEESAGWSCTKELGKWIIDARSQTISPITCRFYSETDSNLCEVRGS